MLECHFEVAAKHGLGGGGEMFTWRHLVCTWWTKIEGQILVLIKLQEENKY